MKRQKRAKGFTLVELLVVIAIIAILATVSVVGYIVFKGLTLEQVKNFEVYDLVQYGEEFDATSATTYGETGFDASTLYNGKILISTTAEELPMAETEPKLTVISYNANGDLLYAYNVGA